MIWLQTMKHTGTHWMMEHLINMGLKQAVVNVDSLRISSGDFIQAHLGENFGILRLTRDDDTIITTMRNPIRIYQSHKKRYRISAREAERRVFLSFLNWREIRDFSNTLVIYIDNGCEERQMMELASKLAVTGYQYKEVPNTLNVSVVNREDIPGPFPPTKAIIELAKEMGYRT